MGIDTNFPLIHPEPMVFETMVFGGLLDGSVKRSSNFDAAMNDHYRMIHIVVQAINQDTSVFPWID
jgi:hypothetical protein